MLALARYNSEEKREREKKLVNISSIGTMEAMGREREGEREAMGTRGVANLTTFNDVASAIRSLDV